MIWLCNLKLQIYCIGGFLIYHEENTTFTCKICKNIIEYVKKQAWKEMEQIEHIKRNRKAKAE